jgi:hypothetical protein
MRSRKGLLGMVAMSSCHNGKGNETQHRGNHDAGQDSILLIEEMEKVVWRLRELSKQI